MWKDLVRSWPLRGGHTGPWPPIQPPKMSLVRAHWSPDVLPPTIGNWLDATGIDPEKNQEDQAAQM